jgi:hypothetical protein
MDITVSVDDTVAEKARELAYRQGTTVQEMLCSYLETLVGERPGETVAAELLALMRESPGHSGGYQFRREDVYEDRM